MINKYIENAGKIFSREEIPSQPTIILDIEKELRKRDPNFSIVAKLVSKDISLSSATLVTVNSAFFGLKNQITSIRHAVSILGIKNIIHLVKSISLRTVIGEEECPLLNEFWVTSMEIAMFMAYLAKNIARLPADDAYTIGLFHNSGVPLMKSKFENYEKKYHFGCRNRFKSLIDVENENFKTNHCAAGYFLSVKWELPEIFCNTILHHHNVVDCINNHSTSMELKTWVAILKIAEYVSYKNHEDFKFVNISEWPVIKDTIFKFLAIDEKAIDKIGDHLISMVKENKSSFY